MGAGGFEFSGFFQQSNVKACLSEADIEKGIDIVSKEMNERFTLGPLANLTNLFVVIENLDMINPSLVSKINRILSTGEQVKIYCLGTAQKINGYPLAFSNKVFSRLSGNDSQILLGSSLASDIPFSRKGDAIFKNQIIHYPPAFSKEETEFILERENKELITESLTFTNDEFMKF